MILSYNDLLALAPLLVLSLFTLLVMLAAALLPSRRPPLALTLLGLVLTCAVLPLADAAGAREVTPLFLIDRFALYYIGLVALATLVVAVLCDGYFAARTERHGTLHLLLLLAALGGAVLAASAHFASFLLGLELYSIALFALIAFPREAEQPLEAGIKYLVLTGFSSAFLLFGMALVYARTGTMQFAEIGASREHGSVLALAGLALILVGVGFKLALAPFHMWIPDVYQGAPAPVAALVATVSKGAVLALLLRYFVAAGGYRAPALLSALSWLAIASILAGNLLALLQDNIKRMLAYSSIAHLGYLLIAFLGAGPASVEAIGYYLAAYFVTMLGAFGIVTLISSGGIQPDRDRLADYQGLLWRRPWLAAGFTAFLLSLAGIPLTMGFVGKFYVAAVAVSAALWLPAAALVLGSAIGLFYYLRVIAVMAAAAPEAAAPLAQRAGAAPRAMLALLVAVLLVLGAYPGPLIQVLGTTSLQQAAR